MDVNPDSKYIWYTASESPLHWKNAENLIVNEDWLIYVGKDYVYALVIGWPSRSYVILGSVVSIPSQTLVSLVGPTDAMKLDFKQTQSGNYYNFKLNRWWSFLKPIFSGLYVTFPLMSEVERLCGPGCQWVYTLRLERVQPVSEPFREIFIENLWYCKENLF